ncbi:protein-S-isoprenylcysteine O-methyltransferase B isoform X1 [Arachis duranensis]|uniref:Protein-S-isoprenylcysteine O-methyltransferase n=1 Tax=Arachis duranensis TaxID=130453 RepID=A0A9C6TMZ3_ARADU|nr:protein-S-isoprenylcysteine O-methyltransferase B isoform X1 [Arachis duranensis]
MSYYLKLILGDIIQYRALILHYSASFSEIFSYTACRQLSQMFLAILFFHTSEFILAIVIHGRSNVTLSSLLISAHYILAMIFSLAEYIFEIVFFPELKEYWVISNVGLAIVVIGEVIRKLAILTAGHAFTHLIRTHRHDDHRLVTHGIYGFMRHPGYSGFFIWSVGTQIMLCNPISVVAFAVVVWRFFAKRIPYEEYFLRRFFGRDYKEYAKKVGSGVPFIN